MSLTFFLKTRVIWAASVRVRDWVRSCSGSLLPCMGIQWYSGVYEDTEECRWQGVWVKKTIRPISQKILENSENQKEIFTLVDKWIIDVSSHQKLIKPTFDIVTAAGYFTYIEILESRNRFTKKSNEKNSLMNFHDKFIHSGAVNFNIKQNEMNWSCRLKNQQSS